MPIVNDGQQRQHDGGYAVSFTLLIPFSDVMSEVWCTLKIMLDF